MNAFAIETAVDQLAARLLARRWRMATAESCTGGWVAKCCTDRPGSSAWFEHGYITYSYEAKVELLAVDPQGMARDGAVSELVARQMAVGACRSPHVQTAVAITGIAGPDGGSPEKPVGTVWFAWCLEGVSLRSERVQFGGDREAIRRAAVEHALSGLVRCLDECSE